MAGKLVITNRPVWYGHVPHLIYQSADGSFWTHLHHDPSHSQAGLTAGLGTGTFHRMLNGNRLLAEAVAEPPSIPETGRPATLRRPAFDLFDLRDVGIYLNSALTAPMLEASSATTPCCSRLTLSTCRTQLDPMFAPVVATNWIVRKLVLAGAMNEPE